MSYSGRHPWDSDDPYPYDDEPECDHIDYEADILTGLATCACGHRWMQTSAEIERERHAAIAYDKQCEEWDCSPALPPSPLPPTGDDIPF